MTAARIVAQGTWVRLVAHEGWEWVSRTRGRVAVAVVAVTDARELVLVEQMRKPVAARTIELPAGLVGDVDGAEAPRDAARRELHEETGWEASELHEIAQGPTSAGITDELVVLWRATGLRRVGPGGGDASEDIVVHAVPLADAAAWLRARAAAGILVDVKVWAGLWFAAEGAP
jgi:ADP-ribose pyrophosphatase